MIENESGEVTSKLRTLQILYAALLGGALMFLGISVLVSTAMVERAQEGDPDAAPVEVVILRYVWFGVAVFSTFGVMFARKFLPKAAAMQIDVRSATPAQLFGPYFITTILTAAVLEGVSIFGSIIVLLGDNPIDVTLALIPLAIMLPFFPTNAAFTRFADNLCGRTRSEEGLAVPSRDFRKY